MAKKKLDCSELSNVIYEIATNLGSRPEFRTVDQVIAEIRKDLPELSKKAIVDSIVEAGAARKRKPVPKSKEQRQAEFQEARTKNKIRGMISRLKPRTTRQIIWSIFKETLNVPRAIITSGEFSAVLRQGKFIFAGNPIRVVRSLPAMFKTFMSEQATFEINEAILHRDNAPIYAESGLYIAPLGETADLSQFEEGYQSAWAMKIPGVRASARAYTTFLNKLRADSFDIMAATMAINGEPTAVESKAIAHAINVFTGRGSLGMAENAAHALATAFFSPRYVSSRFQLLVGQPMWGGTMRTRKLIAKEYVKTIIGMSIYYALLLQAFPDDAEVEEDPRSSDFGKIRLGNTRLDILAGMGQVIVATSRVATGKTKTLKKGEIRPLRGDDVPYGGQDIPDVVFRFVRSKVAPVPGTAFNIFAQENVIGEDVTVASTARDLLIPIAWRDIHEAMRDHGVPDGLALSLLAFFGEGVNVYQYR